METQIHYKVLGIRFAGFGENAEPAAQVIGSVRTQNYTSKFELFLTPLENGEWQGRSINWQRPALPVLQSEDFLQQLVNHCAKFLYTTHMWPSSQDKRGAQISMNQKVIPQEYDDRVIISVRHHMLSVPPAQWPRLWEHIELRVRHDPFFRVLGFERHTLENVLPCLKRIFPAGWVKARFRAAGLKEMNDPIEPVDEGFFPAYHLARAAHGLICRDPGWNYLVEIGLALEQLRDVDGLARLEKKLAKSPGTQHHLCLAAELHKRDLLIGLEPPTGAGAASSDLLVALEEQQYQVEVKEFSSRKPLNALRKELADKVKKLPASPDHPVVFHVVFRETGAEDVRIEQEFFRSISKIADEIPAQISAVVAGRRFVDSLGGLVKRDCEVVLVNDQALMPSSENDLREIFQRNYETAHLPYYGLASLFVFGPRRGEEAGAGEVEHD